MPAAHCPVPAALPWCLPNPRLHVGDLGLHMLKPAFKVHSTYYIHHVLARPGQCTLRWDVNSELRPLGTRPAKRRYGRYRQLREMFRIEGNLGKFSMWKFLIITYDEV